jgi:hypothetical protein
VTLKSELLELTVAAQRAGLSPKQMLRLVTLGQVEGQKIDGRWMVSAQSIAVWRQRHQRSGQTGALR